MSKLVNLKKLLNEAYIEKKAIGHFNINNLEWAKAILLASKESKSPLIIGVSMGASKYMGGYKTVVNLVEGLIQDLEIDQNIVLHLDHGGSFEECKKAIDAGFSSVMIDASKYSLKENIEITNKVVQYASKFDVSVEAEVGSIGGDEDGTASNINYASLEDCIEFSKKTNIDTLAVGYGSMHGPYSSEVKLDFNLLSEINKNLNIPLVLHGASGIDDEKIKKSIENGICKININTECQIRWAKKIKEFISENNKVYDPRKIIGSGLEEIKNVVKDKIRVFNNN